jgi:hypothetical protein
MKVPRLCQALMILCWTVISLLVILRMGIGATPDETVDSLGRKMGFNDPLSLEHYGIIIRNFRPSLLFQWEYFYEWILFGAFAAGCVFVWSRHRFGSPGFRLFFAAQLVLFPAGWFGFLFFPGVVRSILAGTMDREGFTDVPFLWGTAQTIWLSTSILILVATLGKRSDANDRVRNGASVGLPY